VPTFKRKNPSVTDQSNVDSERLPPCPACRGESFRFLFVKKGRRFWHCRTCHLERQYPLPSMEDLDRYYDNAYRQGMYKVFSEADRLKTLSARHRFRTIRSHCRPGRWLDVGASDGLFVEHVRSKGIDAEVIEVAEVAVDKARSRGLPIHRTTLEEFDPDHRFDTITAFDVLEHVLDPVGFVRSIHRRLKPSGRFVLALPNQASVYRMVMGKRWFHYVPEEHLFHFNPRCIEGFLGGGNLVLFGC
jgi:SAM-dependent methyltransferase